MKKIVYILFARDESVDYGISVDMMGVFDNEKLALKELEKLEESISEEGGMHRCYLVKTFLNKTYLVDSFSYIE